MARDARGATTGGSVVADEFAIFFHLLLLGIGIVVVLLSPSYLKANGLERGEYYALLLFSIVGMLGLVSCLELVAIFVALEIMSIALYGLAGMQRARLESQESALKYFVTGAFSSALFLYGVALVYGVTGSTSLDRIARSLAALSPDSATLAVLGYVRQTVRLMDPNLPLADVQTLARVADNSLSQARFTTMLLGLFAALALALATIGIYGVISLLVTRRRQEIGIRIALGARPGSILSMVVRRGMTLAGVGVLLGLAGALMMTRALTSLLYGVTRFDALTFTVAPAILASVALLACLIPAGRAATVDPVIALREE